jgi:N-acetyl-gamma-glutamyl-phosphate reductase
MAKVGVIGASGYAGAELLRLAASHPELEVAVATGTSQAGEPIAALYPNLAGVVGDQRFEAWDPMAVDGLDLVFLALPHGESQKLLPELDGRVGLVVDLAADFRLKDPELYPTWYGEAHRCPERLTEFAYGLPELFRPDILTSNLVAAPGCYVTAAALALTPLVRAGLVETTGIVVDAASGVSGAGRPPKAGTTFCTVDEDFSTYGLLTHRHTPEMEQVIGAQLLFTPHLAPMNRGILATCYARPVDASLTTEDARDVVRAAYSDEPFVVVREGALSTKATQGSNTAHVSVVVDPRTGWVVACGALDNLVKGAAGQAVQCANLLLGLPETTGLATAGLYP